MSNFNYDNERPDIQLGHDRSKGKIRENQANDRIKNSQMPDYSKSKRGAKTMYQVIKALVLEGKHGCLIYREDLKIFEGLSLDLNEAVDAVCIEFGISSDDFDPNIRDMGHQVQIRI